MNKTYADFTDLYTGGILRVTVDSDTKSFLDEHFMYREVNDDNKFKFFYQRDLNLYYPRYALMVLDQLSELPDLVDYKEFIINQKQAGKTLNDTISNITSKITSDTESKIKNVTDSDTYGGTDAVTGTVGVANSYSEDDDLTHGATKTNTGTQTTAQTADAKHVHIEKALPQSASYVGATAGVIPDLHWGTASGQSQDADNNGTTQRTDNLSEAMSGTDARDISGSGSETTTYNTLDTKASTHSSTLQDNTGTTKSGTDDTTASGTKESVSDEKVAEYNRKEIMTKFETELRENIWNYIRNHNAIEDLFAWLEDDFLPVRF